MKKIVCLILSLCIFLSLCGCSASGTDALAESSAAVQESIAAEAEATPAEASENTQTAANAQSDSSQNTSSAQKQTTAAEGKKQSSDTTSTTQDKYKTDPVPEGNPSPQEPETQTVNTTKSYTCTFSIECSTVLSNMDKLDSDKVDIIPKNGVILAPQSVTFYEGESVFDVLQRVCKENKIHMEFSFTPMYNSAYIEGISNLYEFDCGSTSGWMYCVDGWYPNYGCSRYTVKQGQKVEWRYTCDLGNDIGGKNAAG